MGKKHRKKKLTVYGCCEGDREEKLLKHLEALYKPQENNINFNYKNASGGKPDRIVGFALKNNDRDKVFAWLDEDFEPENPLSQETKESLAECWNVPKDKMQSFFSCS